MDTDSDDSGDSRDDFIRIWEEADTIDEAFDEMAEVSEANDGTPMDKSEILMRASRYLAQGIQIKRMKAKARQPWE